jgi:hypothetical protein
MSDPNRSYPIPRVSRTGVELWWERRPAARPAPARRPVAHALTVLGFNADGPTYTFECRAEAADLGKTCAVLIICECERPPSLRVGDHMFPVRLDPTMSPDRIRFEADTPGAVAPCPHSPTGHHEWRDGFTWRPARGCRYAVTDADDTDDAIRELISKRSLARGVYFVHIAWTTLTEEIKLELLAEMCTVVGWLPVEPVQLTVRPTEATRYPGYGPEVEVRELIEHSLAEADGAVEWADEELAVVVDAQEAARQVVAWVERTYDVPSDQAVSPLLPARVKTFDPLPVATVHARQDML